MKTTNQSIGSFEAKIHFSSLLDNVQKGFEFTITKRGKPVAKLVAYKNDENQKIDDIIDEFDTIRNSVKGKVKIKEFIQESRKY